MVKEGVVVKLDFVVYCDEQGNVVSEDNDEKI